jgi:hypothetical protein
MSSSQSPADVAALRKEIVKLGGARKIEQVQRMVRDLEQKMEKDLAQKMKRMKADLRIRAALENERRDRLLESEKRDREADKKEAQHHIENERRDRLLESEKNERLLENEKRDRLLENEKRDREADKKEAQRDREADKKEAQRDREADKKEAQHQIDQLKLEVRLCQMEQQLQVARGYNVQPLSNPVQSNAGTNPTNTIQPLANPAQYTAATSLAPQRENEELVQVQELKLRQKETSSSHLVAAVAAVQPALPISVPRIPTPAAALISTSAPALPAAQVAAATAAVRPQASTSQPLQHQHQPATAQPTSNTPSKALRQQRTKHQQHQVNSGPVAIRAGAVPLPGDARSHFFLSHCQATGGDQTNAIYLELRELGLSCW